MTSFRPDPLATQSHFELTNEGGDLSVAVYLKGHKAPDMFDYLPDTRIIDVLKTLEQAGYAVHMYDHGNSTKAIKDQPMTEQQVADREFAAAVASLDPKAQVIMRLLRDGNSFAEIANALGLSRSAISQKMATIQRSLLTVL